MLNEPDTIGFLLSDVARILRTEFEKRIANAGLELTPGEARALINVSVRQGTRQNVIAEKMAIEPMTLSVYLDKLETMGLVERVPDPTDRRAKNVVPTGDAEAMITEVRRHAAAVMDALQTGLDGEEREAVRRALKMMRSNSSLFLPADIATDKSR
jgi:MarR family transcriptional regulator, transcriptional regulator for hemolysin